MSITLHPHQKDDLAALKANRAYALWHEVGGGKTFPLIFRMMESLLTEKKKWIVVCEVQLIDQWEEEIMRVMGDIKPTIAKITGSSKQFERMIAMQMPFDILITNYEFFPKIELQLYNLVRKGDVAGMICDEAHRMKGFRGFRSSSGSRAKSIVKVAHATLGTDKEIARYMASGSPIVSPDSPDVWGLYYFLDKRIFGDVLWRFENEFFYNTAHPGVQWKKYKLRKDMSAEMSRRMFTIARRLLKAEMPGVNFPDQKAILYKAELPAKARLMYESLKENCFVMHEDKPITRLMLLARLMALQQISSGFILEDRNCQFDEAIMLALDGDIPDNKRVIHLDSSHKDKILWSIIDEIGRDKHVVIWAHFRHELEHIASMLEAEGITTARVWGDETRADKKKAIAEFKEGKRIALIGQPASAGAGLNLQIAGHSIRYSRSHRLLDQIQSEGRIHRASSAQFHKCVTYHEIVTRDTYDEYVYRNLIEKRDLSAEITLDSFRDMRTA